MRLYETGRQACPLVRQRVLLPFVLLLGYDIAKQQQQQNDMLFRAGFSSSADRSNKK